MGLFNIIIIVVLAIAGGAISFGAYKLKQRFSRKKLVESEDQEIPVENGLDPDVPFPDLVDSVTFETPPAPPVDISSEFASLHKSLREIAKAQVSIIESGQSGEDEVEASKLEEALNSLQSVKDETQSLIEGVSERLEKMSEQLASNAETGDTQPQNTEFLGLLEQIAARPDAPDLSAISDLLLPQIALLGEDVTRLATQAETSSSILLRMDNVEALLQDILTQSRKTAPAEPSAISSPPAQTASIVEEPPVPDESEEQNEQAATEHSASEGVGEEIAAPVQQELAGDELVNNEPVEEEIAELELNDKKEVTNESAAPEEGLPDQIEVPEQSLEPEAALSPEPEPKPEAEPEKAKGVAYIPAGETERFEPVTEETQLNRLSV